MQQKKEEVIGKPLFEARPDLGERAKFLHSEVYRTGERFVANEIPVDLITNGKTETRYFNAVIDPLCDEHNEIVGQIATSIEISEQVLARKKIKESEERYATTVNASDLGLWDFDVLNQKVVAAGKMAEIYGLSSNEDYNLQMLLQSIHPDEVEGQQKLFNGILEGKVSPSFETEYRIIKKDTGDTRWIRAKGRAFFNSEGILYRTVGTVADITEQRKAEEALVYQKKLLETVTENTDMALLLLDERQRCIYLNERAEKMTGYTLEELQGKQLHYYIHYKHPDGSSYPPEECPIDQALPTHKRMKGEEIFIHKDGSFYSVAFTASPIIIEGKAIGTVIEVRDTTEEKKKQTELIESEERFRSLAENLPQMIWVTDAKGTGEYYSGKWKEYSGIEDPYEAWAYMIHPDDEEKATTSFDDAYNKEIPFKHEVRLKNKAGEYHWYNSVAEPLRDAQGKIVKWIGVLTDIEDQKTAQQAIKTLLEKKDEFISIASHELKTLLRA